MPECGGVLLRFVVVLTLFLAAAAYIHRKQPSPPLPGRAAHQSGEKHPELVPAVRRSSEVATWTFSLISAALVGLTGIFPLLVLNIDTKTEAGLSNTHKTLLGFAVGGLLGDVFLHLLPETYGRLGMNWRANGHGDHVAVGLWVMVGLLSFMFIEKLVSETETKDEEQESREEEHETAGLRLNGEVVCNGLEPSVRKREKLECNGVGEMHQNGVAHHVKEERPPAAKKEPVKISVTGYLNLAANCTDNLTHGLAISASYMVGMKVGVLTTVAILLHEIPHEVGDFAILLNAGFDRWSAAKAQIATSTGGIIGALLGLVAEGVTDSTAWILPFTAGGFIYIAMVTIIPQLIQEQNLIQSLRQLAAILTGIAVMMAVSYVEVL